MTDPPPRPSPFVDDEGEAAAAADDDADTAAGAATNLRNTLAGLSSKSAWSEAWEEATEAPLIAAALSGTSFTIAQCMVDERRETESVKADEAAAVTLRHSPLATWRSDAVRLLSLALPIAISNLLNYFVSAVGVSFVGRLGGLQLSAAVLASSIYNVTGQSIMMGLCGTIDTLAGQAFGARNFQALGAILQRALLVNFVFGAAIAVAWLRSERLFLLLGQEEALSATAARYLSIVAPCLPCVGILEACRRFLMAQGIVRPTTVVTACAAVLAPFYNWLFIVWLGKGLDGAAMALVALQLTSLLLLGSYVVYRNASMRGREDAAWQGWSRAAFSGWGVYLSLALPSVIMICCKWWSFEALILQAGWFPDAQLAVATMGLCSVTNAVVYMLLFGISMSASVRISNALGAGCPRGARRATLAAFGMTLLVLAAAITSLLLLKDKWVRLLTDVEPVIAAVVGLMPVFCLSLVGDGINVSLQALLRGAGKQKWGAMTNITSYWLLAIPLAHYLAFNCGWGVRGLWWGIATANTVQAAVMGIIVARFDYEAEARAAAARFALRAPLLQPDGGEEQA